MTATLRAVGESEWMAAEAAHAARVGRWTSDRLKRQSRHERDPVRDFLFEYYGYRPGQLARWSPGIGTVLEGARAERFMRRTGFRQMGQGVAADVRCLPERRWPGIVWTRNLLKAVAGRPAQFQCFGWHEWAMVYGAGERRHEATPLRMERAELDAIVAGQRLCCSHVDAYRFFTEPARPLNRWQLRREDQMRMEQPGCIHATMDLYKWAFKGSPFVPSSLVMDCFELAAAAREVDMRASPYDLAARGLQPICIETESGRAEYQAIQRDLAERAVPLRAALIAWFDAMVEQGGRGAVESGAADQRGEGEAGGRS